MNIQEIEKIVCAGENIDPVVLHENTSTRVQKLKEARQIIMYFAVTELRMSHLSTGQFYNKDHSTTFHAKKVIEDLIYTDKIFAAKIEDFRKDIKAVLNMQKVAYNFAEILKPLKADIEVIEIKLKSVRDLFISIEPQLKINAAFAEMLKNEINNLQI